jgi:hypothetical protein
MGGNVRDFKSIPIIGQPKVVTWRPLIVAQCSCGRGEPIVITSTDRAPACSGCNRLYALAELHFKTDGAGSGEVEIGLMEVRPPSASTN